MRTMLVVSTSVLVLLAAPILSEVLIEDQFTSFTGWNYSSENCSGFSVTCDGNYISPASYGICGGDQWEGIEKILPTPITANQDFEVSFRPFVASDPSGQMGGVFVFCMNDFGEIVAQLTWFEPQFSSGFGGVTFWAEGSLIFGDLSGFDSEYPTIDATLKLSRSGNQWSASVDDTQKGTTLSLSPSKDITRVLVAFYNFSDYQERDIKVDFIRLETTGSGWCDDFEDYETGSHPSTWHGTGNFGATMVDNTISYSGNNSLKFFGAIGSCWAGLATRPINVSCPFTIELAIRNGTEDLYGCHPERGSVEFKMGPNWPDPGVPGGFLFMENGDLKISLPDGQHIFSGFALNE